MCVFWFTQPLCPFIFHSNFNLRHTKVTDDFSSFVKNGGGSGNNVGPTQLAVAFSRGGLAAGNINNSNSGNSAEAATVAAAAAELRRDVETMSYWIAKMAADGDIHRIYSRRVLQKGCLMKETDGQVNTGM